MKTNTTHQPALPNGAPCSEEAEWASLCCFAMAPLEVGAMAQTLGISADSFFIPSHADMYGALLSLWQEGAKCDFVTITERLRSTGTLASAKGAAQVSRLFTTHATAFNAQEYITIVAEKALARRIIKVGTMAAASAYTCETPVQDIAAELHRESCALLYSKRQTDKTVTEVCREILLEIASGAEDESHLRTGLPALDEHLRLYRTDFVAITGATGSGKSSLGSQIVISMALAGANALFFPLEMSSKQCLKRAIADVSGRNVEAARYQMRCALRSGDQSGTQEMQQDIASAVGKLIGANLSLPKSARTLASIVAECRTAAAKKPLDVVLIDYIQLLHVEGKFGSRQLEIGYATQTLKRLADELNCIIITPSQVNKQGTAREAEDIENDSNSVLRIIYDKESGDRSVVIGKQREGVSGVELRLKWNGSLTRFETDTEGEGRTR